MRTERDLPAQRLGRITARDPFVMSGKIAILGPDKTSALQAGLSRAAYGRKAS